MAGKLAWRVREGAVREKGRKRHLARQPTSTQETGDHAQMPGAVRREIRAIRRKSDYLKPSLQKVEGNTCGKTSVTGASPCGGMDGARRNPPRPGAMPSQGIQGDGRDA